MIFYAPYVMGRNPELWKDPFKFDHTRFLTTQTTDADGKKRTKSIYRPSHISDYKCVCFVCLSV